MVTFHNKSLPFFLQGEYRLKYIENKWLEYI